jgi:hypothetical protein
VYREKAYDYFIDMIRSIEHRVTKGLLTARPKESLDSVNLEETLLAEYAQNAIASHESVPSASGAGLLTVSSSANSSGEKIIYKAKESKKEEDEKYVNV